MIRVLKTIIFLLLFPTFLYSQDSINLQAIKLLDKNLKNIIDKGSISIYFEGIVFGIKQPLKVFSMAEEDIYRGGYYVICEDKYDIQLGILKVLSNGKLVVIVDETIRMMYIDSVRSTLKIANDKKLKKKGLSLSLDVITKSCSLLFLGKESVNQKSFYKLKATIEDIEGKTEVYYWVDCETEKLVLMADWDGELFDVYWINRIEEPSATYNFSVNLPNKELDSFYGYQVTDMRFIKN